MRFKLNTKSRLMLAATLSGRKVTSSWFDSLTPEMQLQFVQENPDSKYAQQFKANTKSDGVDNGSVMSIEQEQPKDRPPVETDPSQSNGPMPSAPTKDDPSTPVIPAKPQSEVTKQLVMRLGNKISVLPQREQQFFMNGGIDPGSPDRQKLASFVKARKDQILESLRGIGSAWDTSATVLNKMCTGQELDDNDRQTIKVLAQDFGVLVGGLSQSGGLPYSLAHAVQNMGVQILREAALKAYVQSTLPVPSTTAPADTTVPATKPQVATAGFWTEVAADPPPFVKDKEEKPEDDKSKDGDTAPADSGDDGASNADPSATDENTVGDDDQGTAPGDEPQPDAPSDNAVPVEDDGVPHVQKLSSRDAPPPPKKDDKPAPNVPVQEEKPTTPFDQQKTETPVDPETNPKDTPQADPEADPNANPVDQKTPPEADPSAEQVPDQPPAEQPAEQPQEAPSEQPADQPQAEDQAQDPAADPTQAPAQEQAPAEQPAPTEDQPSQEQPAPTQENQTDLPMQEVPVGQPVDTGPGTEFKGPNSDVPNNQAIEVSPDGSPSTLPNNDNEQFMSVVIDKYADYIERGDFPESVWERVAMDSMARHEQDDFKILSFVSKPLKLGIASRLQLARTLKLLK